MKILSLDLLAYGPFTGRILDLSRGEHGLNLVYGLNEAGKSAALRALVSFFYGIHPQTSDNFVHHYDALRIGARLRFSDGTERTFVRRKGSRNTLLDESGSALDESELARFLDGVSRETFTRMYGLDSDALVQGGRELSSGEGELGPVLFAAASGISEVRAAITDLEQEAQGLFKPTGSAPVINRLIADYRRIKKELRESSLSAARWEELQDRLSDAELSGRETLNMIREKTSELARRKRVSDACPDAAELREIRAEIDAVGEVVVLSDDFALRRERAAGRLKDAGEALERDSLALETLRGELAGLQVPGDLLGSRERITALFGRSGQYLQEGEELPRLKDRARKAEQEARRIVRELGLPEGEGDLGELCLSARDRARIEELCESNRELISGLEHRREALAGLESSLSELDEACSLLPGPRDLGALESLLDDFRASGLSEKDLHALQAEARSGESSVRKMMDRLGLEDLPPGGLLALPVPGRKTVNLFSRDFMAAEQRMAELEDRSRLERLRLKRIEDEMRALTIQGDVPTEDQLAQARRRRDALWGLIRDAWLESTDLPEGLWREHAPDDPDPAHAFERAKDEADGVSDRLRRESGRVAQLAQLVAGSESSDKAVREIELAKEKLRERRQALEQSWQETWVPAALKPRSPDEMGEWLVRFDEALDACRQWSALSSELGRKTSAVEDYKKRFADLMAGKTPGEGGSTLSALSRRADELVRRQRDADLKREDLQGRIREVKRQILTREKEIDLSGQQLQSWKKQWRQALAPSGLDEDASPEQARAILGRFSELAEHVREMEDACFRIRAIEANRDRFEEEVRSLCAELGRNPSGTGPGLLVEQLNRELLEGLEVRERVNALSRRAGELEEALKTHRGTVEASEGEMRSLLQEAGCDDPSLLPEREALSAAHLENIRRADELRRALSRLAGSAGLEGFLAEVALADADALPREIAELEREIDELEKRRTALDREIGSLRAELGAMEGGRGASGLSEDLESVLARIKDEVRDYSCLTLAASGMRGLLERYSRNNQGQALKRAGEILSRITMGSIHGLAADFDSRDRQVLVGLRNGTRVPVEAMSEGTCDQLYLALRLASLERRLAEREPMPLVLDDVLVNFDDPRAGKVLEVFAELSKHTQVILFTHHCHLLDLARRSVAPDVLFVHEL